MVRCGVVWFEACHFCQVAVVWQELCSSRALAKRRQG